MTPHEEYELLIEDALKTILDYWDQLWDFDKERRRAWHEFAVKLDALGGIHTETGLSTSPWMGLAILIPEQIESFNKLQGTLLTVWMELLDNAIDYPAQHERIVAFGTKHDLPLS